jgi:hypothetical protein
MLHVVQGIGGDSSFAKKTLENTKTLFLGGEGGVNYSWTFARGLKT